MTVINIDNVIKFKEEDNIADIDNDDNNNSNNGNNHGNQKCLLFLYKCVYYIMC